MESSFLDKYIRRIRKLLEEFEEFKVSHTLREENVINDKIANVGVRFHDRAKLERIIEI